MHCVVCGNECHELSQCCSICIRSSGLLSHGPMEIDNIKNVKENQDAIENVNAKANDENANQNAKDLKPRRERKRKTENPLRTNKC